MCKVSNKIKFCTCHVDDMDDLPHFWIFHSYHEEQELMVVGSPIMPVAIDEATDLINREALLKRVNEQDAFDVELLPKEKDRLQLSFSCEGERNFGRLDYGFEYRDGKWEEEDYESFDWMMKHKEKQFGEINPALEEDDLVKDTIVK
jgi:hypothetical protein